MSNKAVADHLDQSGTEHPVPECPGLPSPPLVPAFHQFPAPRRFQGVPVVPETI